MGNDNDGGSVSSVTFKGVADTVEGAKLSWRGCGLDEATAGGQFHELRTAVVKLQDKLGQALETERVRNKKLSVGVCQAICSVFDFMSDSFGFLAGSHSYYRGQVEVLTSQWRGSPLEGSEVRETSVRLSVNVWGRLRPSWWRRWCWVSRGRWPPASMSWRWHWLLQEGAGESCKRERAACPPICEGAGCQGVWEPVAGGDQAGGSMYKKCG
ncbi:hypothetical protein LSTR_LSTR015421 [Laodelphax striatellus]|uniref:Uncharacterized protein n=1 Tax=Laodelphax striatellus TaxID=195883 RepID=A0A482X8C2_LAOST|nr:hypothetical protein LSTR_LSTR015421 [Laodelphax striatellus]